MSNLQAALSFLAKYPQARLFPATWDNGHRPHIKWSEHSLSSEAEVLAWSSLKDIYFCINLRASGMSVIDTDNKNGKLGDANLMDIMLDTGEILPPSLTVSTPSGGHHQLFLGAMAFGANRIGPGIDSPVMIPVPGSVVPGKGAYVITNDAPIAPLPDWVAALAGQRSEKAPDRDDSIVEPDLEYNVARATEYLISRAPEAIEGAGGDATAYKVACRVRDMGVAESTAIDIMLEHYAPKCVPFDAPWLISKIGNAYAYAQAPLGAAAPPLHLVDEVPDGGALLFTDLECIRAAELMDSDPAPVDWLVTDWLTKGDPCLFTGEGGTGKSLLTMQLFTHLACGRPIFGLQIPDPVKCVMILCEDDRDEIHRRFKRIIDHPAFALDKRDLRLIKENLRFYSMVGRDAIITKVNGTDLQPGPFLTPLNQIMKSLGRGPKALALDTVADVYAGDENNRSHVNQFVKNHICRLLGDHDATGILIGHPPKSGAEYSGSTAWNGAFRSRMFLEMHEQSSLKDTHRVLKLPKSNRGPTGQEITVAWNNGVYTKVDSVELVVPGEEQNMNLLLEKITHFWEAKNPISITNGQNSLKELKMKGFDGKKIAPDELKRLVNLLLSEQLIENVKGEKRGNGLRPCRSTPQ